MPAPRKGQNPLKRNPLTIKQMNSTVRHNLDAHSIILMQKQWLCNDVELNLLEAFDKER
jgi:hypothetical protein